MDLIPRKIGLAHEVGGPSVANALEDAHHGMEARPGPCLQASCQEGVVRVDGPPYGSYVHHVAVPMLRVGEDPTFRHPILD